MLVPALLSVFGATLLNVFRLAFFMILVRALRGILGVTLIQVLVLAMLFIARRTVWLIMFLPNYVTLLLFLPQLLQESRRQPQGSQDQEGTQKNFHCTCYSGSSKYNPH